MEIESQGGGGAPAAGVAAILLAAGRSRRMGRPKQLLRLEDEGPTIVEELVRRLSPLVDTVVVVVGHVGGQVAAVLADLDAVLAVNPEVDRGMLSSVQAGLRAAGRDRDGYLVCLGDQPQLDAGVVRAVLDAAANAAANAAADGEAGIVVPTWDGRRGHPVYLDRRYYDEILSLDPETCGLNRVTRGHAADTVEVAVEQPAILDDMDTPADLARERRRRRLGADGAGREPA